MKKELLSRELWIRIRIPASFKLNVGLGYLGDKEATSHAFCGDFYLTGDRATQDEDGYFWFKSRNDDLIISSGYRIGPFEVGFF